jgi:hypothetical protein
MTVSEALLRATAFRLALIVLALYSARHLSDNRGGLVPTAQTATTMSAECATALRPRQNDEESLVEMMQYD